MRRCVHWEEAQRVDTCPLCRSLISSRICMDGRVIVQEPRRSWPRAFQTASGAERSRAFVVSKPVVYLYPPHPLVAEVTVTVVPNSKLVVLIPTPNRESRGTGSVTWAVEAQPDGTLTLLPAPEAVPSAPEDPLAPRSPRGEGPGASQAAAVVVSSLFWESEFTGHLRGAPSRASAVGCRPALESRFCGVQCQPALAGLERWPLRHRLCGCCSALVGAGPRPQAAARQRLLLRVRTVGRRLAAGRAAAPRAVGARVHRDGLLLGRAHAGKILVGCQEPPLLPRSYPLSPRSSFRSPQSSPAASPSSPGYAS